LGPIPNPQSPIPNQMAHILYPFDIINLINNFIYII
jgi:hypothetical protein